MLAFFALSTMSVWRKRERIVIFKIIELGIGAVAHGVSNHLDREKAKKISTKLNPADDMPGLYLETVNKIGVQLRGMNLSGKNLSNFKLIEADLTGAN